MKKVLTCVGTRPNFIKITRLDENFKNYPDIEHKFLHTGQHFDYNMSNVFFKELGIRKPDFSLNVKGETQTEIVARIMIEFEKFVSDYNPDYVLVPGDVNSSFACAFVSSRLGIPVAHIESGLRSFDKTMPEEINRILIDDLSDLHFVSEPSGIKNLKNENKKEKTIFFVGNTMIDSLVAFKKQIQNSNICNEYNLKRGKFVVITLHRPHNVDVPEQLSIITSIINQISGIFTVIFPVHPRTYINLRKFGLSDKISTAKVIITEPLGYLDFIKLISESSCVITDSGGVQEETTYLNVPCLTLRPNTERPVTITHGSNKLITLSKDAILKEVHDIKSGNYKVGNIPELWDGNASKRIVEELANHLR